MSIVRIGMIKFKETLSSNQYTKVVQHFSKLII